MPFIVYSQLISNWQANQLSQSAGLIIISHSAEIYPQLIADWLAYCAAWVVEEGDREDVETTLFNDGF
jgi:hypothetical protein